MNQQFRINAPLTARAYQLIRDKILRGEYPLGSAISRRKIAIEFSMSLLPVSEAVQRLENEGLLESKPKVGTRVFIPTVESVRERYVMREALETQAARLFALKASKSLKAKLLKQAAHLDQLYAGCSADNVSRNYLFSVHNTHLAFHLQIAEGAESKLLYQAIENQQILIFNWLFDTVGRRRPLPKSFHLDLAESLARGDVQIADTAMRHHIEFGLPPLLEQVSQLFQPQLIWRRKNRPNGLIAESGNGQEPIEPAPTTVKRKPKKSPSPKHLI